MLFEKKTTRDFFSVSAVGLLILLSNRIGLADPPPQPPVPQITLPGVFCFRITDIEEIKADPLGSSFNLEFEVLNWTGTAADGLSIISNAGSTITSGFFPEIVSVGIDANGRGGPFQVGSEIGGPSSESPPIHSGRGAPGFLNDWSAGLATPTTASWDGTGGTAIPARDLLGAATQTQAAVNALIPSTGLDARGDLAIDGGPGPYSAVVLPPGGAPFGGVPAPGSANVLDGFVLTVTDFDEGEVLSLNWDLTNGGQSIGVTGMGNTMGNGVFNLTRLPLGGPPAAPAIFVGNTGMVGQPTEFVQVPQPSNEVLDPSLFLSEFGGGLRAPTLNSNDTDFGGEVNAVLTDDGGIFSPVVTEERPILNWRFTDTGGHGVKNLGSGGLELAGAFSEQAGRVRVNDLVGIGDDNHALDLPAGQTVRIAPPMGAVNQTPMSNLQEFTMAAWINFTDEELMFEGRSRILGQTGTIELGLNNGNLDLRTRGGGGLQFSAELIEPDTWNQVVAVGTGEELQLFVNGEQVATGGMPTENYGTPAEGFDAEFMVGGTDDFFWRTPFSGMIDEIAVWDRALDPDAIGGMLDAAMTSPPAPVVGDFNNDQLLDDTDIDALSRANMLGVDLPMFDLNEDANVNQGDRITWVEDLRNTYFGDANLDGEFNSSDLVQVFERNEFEDGIPLNSRWASGDWNGDREFDSQDLILAFQRPGYELGPRASAVPEPTGSTPLVVLAICTLATIQRRRDLA